ARLRPLSAPENDKTFDTRWRQCRSDAKCAANDPRPRAGEATAVRSGVMSSARGVIAGLAIIVGIASPAGFLGCQMTEHRPLPRLTIAALQIRSLGINVRHHHPPTLQVTPNMPV